MSPFNLLSNNLLDHAFISPVGKYFYIHSQHCFHFTYLLGNAWLETMVSAQYWFYFEMICAARHAAFTCWVGDLCTSHYCNLAQAHHKALFGNPTWVGVGVMVCKHLFTYYHWQLCHCLFYSSALPLQVSIGYFVFYALCSLTSPAFWLIVHCAACEIYLKYYLTASPCFLVLK